MGVPSLSIAYDMTWAEFCIRMQGYNLKEENEWIKVREMAYASLVGSHLNPKKLPSKKRFIPIGRKKKPKIDERAKQMMLNAWSKYNKEKNG